MVWEEGITERSKRQTEERRNDLTVEKKPEERFDLVLWYIKHCRLFNAKLDLYIYIKYI